ncbi:MAG: metallophosphoesterase [Desulfobacca sp.]|uniref:metallophosphoesterase n=1 Tax=Desulfobacca sp. TaxID=2067990 RepID=UPI00404B2E21
MPDPFPVLSQLPDYQGLLFIGDPHVAASPPGYRLDDYRRTILEKLAFCLDMAGRNYYLPIILGDLFHLPRNNPNHLLVDLIELFRPYQPWVLVGNHDKHEARLTRDVSLAVLAAAGVIRLLADPGPVARVQVGQHVVLIGASPDWTPLPEGLADPAANLVVWLSHHDLRFPDYEGGRVALKELPGIDLVVNGHLHTPKPPSRCGQTLWWNPGSISRLTRSFASQSRQPAVSVWRPGMAEPEVEIIPHRPFAEVFVPLEEDEAIASAGLDESMFIKGLENLMMRKTQEGLGLRAFLEANLHPHDEVDKIIWELYTEVMDGETQS